MQENRGDTSGGILPACREEEEGLAGSSQQVLHQHPVFHVH